VYWKGFSESSGEIPERKIAGLDGTIPRRYVGID
jgi:hypothetical protein